MKRTSEERCKFSVECLDYVEMTLDSDAMDCENCPLRELKKP